ncbi:hypothetical protein CC1G_08251 [Coprinopsis cinerea okayama7|uniref:F-box domain-containing protein n=1 Tax=Coprinopsis cinerea (strain Okayama-7 / 130 / ATCC MYA-4618 / FGSC 9003) TaxID=240176 RepID=A8P7K8_COPC7|nr:hypothetical protein CC1G_08251 [Coprinopsis cinerea okayama7\|eukprot:XP_001839384.2 hypothetical protein CC1G_08251 [Coprinopsis cinerea okayama7\
MNQQLEPQPPILTLPAELLAQIVSLVSTRSRNDGPTVFEIIQLMQVSRQFYNVLRASPTLWTRVDFSLTLPASVPTLLNGMTRAVTLSDDLPLSFRLFLSHSPTSHETRLILAKLFSTGSRWGELYFHFHGHLNLNLAQVWITELERMRRDAGGISPFTNVQQVTLAHPGFNYNTLPRRTEAYNAALWPLAQLFPSSRKLELKRMEFECGFSLPAQLSIPTLEFLTLDFGCLHNVSPAVVRDILAGAPALKFLHLCARHVTYHESPPPVNLPPHISLETLVLRLFLPIICEQLQALNCPSLAHLHIIHNPAIPLNGSSAPDDFVEAILAMVNQSGCRLKSLDLRRIDLSNDHFVRLFAGLPYLEKVYLTLRAAGGVDENLFERLLERSTNDTILPRLKSFEVVTDEGYTFLTQPFIDFVRDPQRLATGYLLMFFNTRCCPSATGMWHTVCPRLSRASELSLDRLLRPQILVLFYVPP